MAKPSLDDAKLTGILQALDENKPCKVVAQFYGAGPNTVSGISRLRGFIIQKDHAAAAKFIYSDEERISHDTRKRVMKYYGYSVPEEFIPKPEKKPEPKQENPAPTPAPAPQKDYTPYLQSILTQIGTLNATVSVLRDMGTIMHNMVEAWANFMPSVSADLDALKKHEATSNANLNTVIQQMTSLNDRTKTMMQYMKKG